MKKKYYISVLLILLALVNGQKPGTSKNDFTDQSHGRIQMTEFDVSGNHTSEYKYEFSVHAIPGRNLISPMPDQPATLFLNPKHMGVDMLNGIVPVTMNAARGNVQTATETDHFQARWLQSQTEVMYQ